MRTLIRILALTLTLVLTTPASALGVPDSLAAPDGRDGGLADSRSRMGISGGAGAPAGSPIAKIVERVSSFFMGCDTAYVTPQKYQLTAQMELSWWHDYYFLRSSQTRNTMVIQSDPNLILGGHIYYSILGYGAVWNMNDLGITRGGSSGTSMRQSFELHTAKLFGEYYTFRSGQGAEISSVSGMDLRGKDRKFSGLRSKCRGLTLVYHFNNRHFSWPAAFGANAVQRKSCGSWSVGFQYNRQDITFDDEGLSDDLRPHIDPTLLFERANYSDYSVSVGYSYNWVPARNLLLAVSLMPNIGYRRIHITEARPDTGAGASPHPDAGRHSILNNVASDLNLRLSLFWNNTRWFSGLMLEAHTYDYRKDHFGLTNTYGTLKYTVGLNFWKKPEWRGE